MSDLSQLYTNQENDVSLFINDDIKLGNVYLPKNFVNWSADFTRQPAILSIDSFEADNLTVHTTLLQKPLFSGLGNINISPQTVSASGTFGIQFPTPNSIILNQNCGTFDPTTGIMSDMTDGLYRITINLLVSTDASIAVGGAFIGVLINGNLNGIVQVGVVNGQVNRDTPGSNFLVNVVGGSVQFVFVSTTQTAGVFTLVRPNMTLEMISLS